MIDLNRDQALHEAIELLYFGYRGFTDQPDRILARRGLGRPHHRILYFIGRRPGTSVQGLLGLLAVSKQALNAPLRRLIDLKLVETASGAEDRRVKTLRLTADGARLEAELTGAQRQHLQAAFAGAADGDEAAWRRVMRGLAAPER